MGTCRLLADPTVVFDSATFARLRYSGSFLFEPGAGTEELAL